MFDVTLRLPRCQDRCNQDSKRHTESLDTMDDIEDHDLKKHFSAISSTYLCLLHQLP